MKTILLLRRRSQTAHAAYCETRCLPSSRSARPRAVAGCNCDRWGHPCPGCVERIAQPAPELPISMPTKK